MFQGKSDSCMLGLAAHLMKMTAADGVDLSVIHTQRRTHEKYKYCFFKAVSNLTQSNIFKTGATSEQTKQTDPLGFLKRRKEHFKAHFLIEEFLGFLWSPAEPVGNTADMAGRGRWLWQWIQGFHLQKHLSGTFTTKGAADWSRLISKQRQGRAFEMTNCLQGMLFNQKLRTEGMGKGSSDGHKSLYSPLF